MDNPSDAVARLLSHETYATPSRECDVVMKGGITSGVLYPLAVCELAAEYHLRNIGGTSAGAIAAAAAAAAEYGRDSDRPGSGFVGLAALPGWLGSDDNLVGLFQPSPETKPLLDLVVGSMRSSTGGKLWQLVRAAFLLPRRWIPLLAGIVPLLLIAGLALTDVGAMFWPVSAALLALAVAGVIVGAGVSVLLDGGDRLTENGYGLVAGSNGIGGRASLSDWLTDTIDGLAGLDADDGPLTFGQLWLGPEGRTSTDPASAPTINLEMQTTSVTEGRPYRLPDELDGSYAFDETEFRRIFPDRVVDHLIECAGDDRRPGGLIPMPSSFDLPVVVATRLSLSFPLLISAVPLHSVDRSMQEGDTEEFERCWFSDGGITSNFPVSFFDTFLPGRPTFGINLRPFHPRYGQSDDECDNVWMPPDNLGGVIEWWTRWPADGGIRSVVKFGRAIADTMQNWVDNQQTRVPGYRDRIIHISHADDEGGMNLNMPEDTLDRLSERGRCAGARLVEYYTTPPQDPDDVAEGERRRVVSWENHRWVRLRTSLALASDLVDSMAAGLSAEYVDDLGAGLDEAPGYPFTNLDQQGLARAFMYGASDTDPTPRVKLPAGLVELATAIDTVEERSRNVPLSVGSPSPRPILKVTPGGARERAVPEEAE